MGKDHSGNFANVGVGLDAPWNVQPHRWKFFTDKVACLDTFEDYRAEIKIENLHFVSLQETHVIKNFRKLDHMFFYPKSCAYCAFYQEK